MKIAALLSVKDEVELIRASINHLKSIGVDLIIVIDYGSKDGTAEVLEALRTKDSFWVVHVDPRESLLPAAVSDRNMVLVRKAAADWILFLDADEFWVPATGSLREFLSDANADVLSVDRFNVPLTRRGLLFPKELSPAHYQDLFLCVQRIPDFHLAIDQSPETPWIVGAPIISKVLARSDIIRTVVVGGHDVEGVGDETLRRLRPSDLLIAHVPFTTFERFEKKAANIREVVCAYPDFFDGHVAWHWRRWASQWETGQLRAEFDRQLLDDHQLAALIEAGTIRTAAAMFAKQSS